MYIEKRKYAEERRESMQKSGEDREGEREEYGEYPRYQLNEAH